MPMEFHIGDIIFNIEALKALLLRWGDITRMPAVIVSIKYCAGGPTQHSKVDRQKHKYNKWDERKKQNYFCLQVWICT